MANEATWTIKVGETYISAQDDQLRRTVMGIRRYADRVEIWYVYGGLDGGRCNSHASAETFRALSIGPGPGEEFEEVQEWTA